MEMDSILIINTIILALTLGVIFFYTLETYKLRKINQKIFNLEISKLQPNVVAYFEPNPKEYKIRFVISNIGGSTAFNIKVNVDPKFDFGDSTFNRVNKRKIFTEGISILSHGDKLEMLVGLTTLAYKDYRENKIPEEYLVKLSYQNSQNEKFENSFRLNFNQYFDRIIDEDTNVKLLKELLKEFKQLRITLNNYINSNS